MMISKKRDASEISTSTASSASAIDARAEAQLQAAVSSQLKFCRDILNDLSAHPYAELFELPVDVVGLKLTDYHDVIEKPMEFSTIRKRLDVSFYASPQQFFDDVQLTFRNAMLYNPPGTDVHRMAKKLAKFFEKRWNAFTLSGTYDRSAFPAPSASLSLRGGRGGGGVARRGTGRLTMAERRTFTDHVAQLPFDDAVRIAAIIRQRQPDLVPDSIDAAHVLISVSKLKASVVREAERVMAQARTGSLSAEVAAVPVAVLLDQPAPI